MPAKRKMSATELSGRVGITMENLSVLKNDDRAKATGSRRRMRSARPAIASPGRFAEGNS